MIAFYRDGKILVKAYKHGLDWQLISENKELWFSIWQANPKKSLYCAFNGFLGKEIEENLIVITQTEVL